MKLVNKPIEMIAIFELDKEWEKGETAKVKPYRFRLENEAGQYSTIDIQKTKGISKEKVNGILYYKFLCEIIVNDTLKLCEITYNTETMKWYLKKI